MELGAVIEPDATFAVIVVTLAGAVEPEVEADVSAVGGVTAGAMDDAGVDARGSEP